MKNKNIDPKLIIHQFRNECYEQFVIFYSDNNIWITGDELDWEPEKLFEYTSFIYNMKEVNEIRKTFPIDKLKFSLI